MKKLMIAAAIVCAAACANAATSWTFENGNPITGTNGTGVWSGTATITCEALGFTMDQTVSSDGFFGSAETYVPAGDPSQAYTFTLTMTEGNYTYSQTATGQMDGGAEEGYMSGYVVFAGGNAWTAAPEPTSALLMLLGMAGLALKRRRA